jgi:hypothetical protein
MRCWTLSPIYFDSSGTPFREDLFCRSLHGRPQLEVEVHREAVTAIGETYKFIRAGGGKVILA